MCFHLFLFLVLIQSILFLFFLIAFILLPSIQILLWFHGISSSDVWPTLIQTLDIYFSHLYFCPSCFLRQCAPLFLNLSHASHFHLYSLCVRLRRFSLLKTVNRSTAFLSQIFWGTSEADKIVTLFKKLFANLEVVGSAPRRLSRSIFGQSTKAR